jgi:hypothetical protein
VLLLNKEIRCLLKINKRFETKIKTQINMKSLVFPQAGTRLVRLLVVTVLTISAVFSFAPQAMAQTPVSSLFNTSKPRVAHIAPIESSRYQIYINGTKDVFVSSGSQVIDISDPETSLTGIFAGTEIYPNGDNGYSIGLSTDYDYDLAFVSGEDSIDLSIYKMDQSGATVEVVQYCNCSWETTVAADIQITSKGIGDLYYDQNGDGKLDTKVEPNVRDKNPNGVDLENPEVFAEERYQNGEIKLFLTAHDNNKVDRIQYYFGEPLVNEDGTHAEPVLVDKIGQDGKQESVETQTYKNPIKVTEENKGKTVFVTAFDKVGHQSSWVQYTIGSVLPSINNTAIPKGSHTGDILKFSDDPTFYLAIEGDSFVSTGGLIPFETSRMLNFALTTNSSFGGKTITYLNDESHFYTRYVDSTVEKLSTSYIYYCKDHSYENGALVADQGTVYLVMGCTKRPFASMEVFNALGYSAKNIVNGDLDQYLIKPLPAITSKDEAHPWGSWVNYKGTVYYSYSFSQSMIPVPNVNVLTSNGGKLSSVLPATSGDIAEINLSGSSTPAMGENDDRIKMQQIFGPTPEEVAYLKPIAERRDEKRYNDAADINWAISRYFLDNNKVPDSLYQLVPDYIPSIPQAPLPPDGNCTEDQNNYRYERLSDEDYKLHYCYGSKLYGSYDAGPQYSSFGSQQ